MKTGIPWLDESPLPIPPKQVYCKKHNFWYYPREGCSCCKAENQGVRLDRRLEPGQRTSDKSLDQA